MENREFSLLCCQYISWKILTKEIYEHKYEFQNEEKAEIEILLKNLLFILNTTMSQKSSLEIQETDFIKFLKIKFKKDLQKGIQEEFIENFYMKLLGDYGQQIRKFLLNHEIGTLKEKLKEILNTSI